MRNKVYVFRNIIEVVRHAIVVRISHPCNESDAFKKIKKYFKETENVF